MNLIEEVQSIKSDTKTLKSFGITMAVCFGLLAGFLFWKGRPTAPFFAGAAVFFLFFALLKPAWLFFPQKIWMTLALMMGWVMTRLILSALFFVGVTPIALISRFSGKKFLDMKIDFNRSSYWESHKVSVPDKTRYENQF